MTSTSAAIHERETELRDLIDRLVSEIAPLQRAHGEAVWQANATGDAAQEQESARLDAILRRVFARPGPYQHLLRLREAGGVADPLLERQLTLLIHSFRAHQIPPETIDRMVALEKSLESTFNHFRADLGGRAVTDNALREILRASNDLAARREAWEAAKQIGARVSPELLELVRVRNRAARDLGFENYYGMMLELDELSETDLFALLDGLARGTDATFRAYKEGLDAQLARRFGVASAELGPWHYADPFFQEAPPAELSLDPWFRDRDLVALTRRSFAAVGLGIDDLLARADLLERPGKCQHAFCLCIDRGQDIRVLCNLAPNEHWMSTMLHEFGHAVYDQAIDPALPYLLRAPAHTLTTEASAMLFGRWTKSAAWLAAHAGMDAAEAARAERAMRRAMREQLLVLTRWCLVMCHMERALYRDPDQDLDALWWDLVERFQRVRRPPGRRAPDWASKIHFSVAPVYYHNYLLGELMASQLQAQLVNEVLGGGDGAWERYVRSPEVGSWLTDRLYRPGKSIDWREAARRSTGRPLGPEAFVAELA